MIDRATNINESMYIDHEMKKVKDYYGYGVYGYDPLLIGGGSKMQYMAEAGMRPQMAAAAAAMGRGGYSRHGWDAGLGEKDLDIVAVERMLELENGGGGGYGYGAMGGYGGGYFDNRYRKSQQQRRAASDRRRARMTTVGMGGSAAAAAVGARKCRFEDPFLNQIMYSNGTSAAASGYG